MKSYDVLKNERETWAALSLSAVVQNNVNDLSVEEMKEERRGSRE